MKKVEGYTDLRKDEGNTDAIINVNNDEFKAFKRRKQKEKSNKQRLDALESDISEIKEMLVALSKKGK